MPVRAHALALVVLASMLSLLPVRALAQPLVVIDAGHGGSDPGAVGCSIEEADVVLDVTTRLRSHLEAAGIRVSLTRDTDAFVGLSARAAFANSMGADGFVSIHSNANSGTPATGTETWIANAAGDRSLSLATFLQDEMVLAWGLRDRGVKRADFVVVRDTTMPAALTELAFTNNCALDATYLASATRREDMAQAQARAILAWLGVEPGMSGTLRGVVFEDQGVGTMDLSVRLPGATIRVVEPGATATADSPDANWLFMLPPGTYTVEASAPGHTTASRACDVTSGGTTWCSIGLFPTSVPSPDAGAASPDAAMVAEVDAASTDEPDAHTSSAADVGLAMRANAGDCSCRASARGHAPAALWFVIGGVLLAAAQRRRRVARAAVALGLAVLAASCQRAEPARAALSEPAVPHRGQVIVGPPLTLLGERVLPIVAPDGERVTAPQISPDGRAVLVARADFAALYAWADGLVTICETQHCGYEPRHFGDGLVATRTPEQGASATPGDAFTLAGQPSATRLGTHGALAWVESERTLRVRLDGQARTLASDGERYVRAELSPDRRFVAAWSLTRGVVLFRLADGAEFELPGAGHPHFDPAGRVLVFDRTSDEGHTLLHADVWLAVLGEADLTVHPVLDGPLLETQPSISSIDADGVAHVAFERGDAIVVADVAITSAD